MSLVCLRDWCVRDVFVVELIWCEVLLILLLVTFSTSFPFSYGFSLVISKMVPKHVAVQFCFSVSLHFFVSALKNAVRCQFFFLFFPLPRKTNQWVEFGWWRWRFGLLLVVLCSSMSSAEKESACPGVLCSQCRQLLPAKGKSSLFYGACAGSVGKAECSFSNSLFCIKIINI